jgi:predicted AAA+ superfamily ATPase
MMVDLLGMNRLALAELRHALDQFPVVALLGPRQVGKTTLATTLADALGPGRVRYLDLESPGDRARLTDPEAYLEAQRGRLVILDEIHRAPDLFSVLRGLVDRRRRAGMRTGQFLVLGSASLDLLRQSSETLAGRIAFVELPPVRVDEIDTGARATNQLWVRGGFPDSLLARSDAASLTWRRAFVRSYLERDIPQLGPRVPAETLRRFWTMLAHGQAQQLNAARLATGLGVSGQTVARYVDLLVDLLLVRRLPPWSGNSAKRLVRSPKLYVRDSGVTHALLGIGSLEDLLGHPVAGPSWEGFVLEQLLTAETAVNASYYRTSAGAELDLVIAGRRAQTYVVEVKRASAPTVGPGFWNGCEDVGAKEAIVAYSGDEEIPLGDGVRALGVRDAIDWVRERR